MSLRHCPQCGTGRKENAVFCTQCGTLLERSEASQNIQNVIPPREKTKSSVKIITWSLFTAAVILLIIIFIGYMNIEEHRIIAAQPIVSGSKTYDDRIIEMKDISGDVRDGYLVFSLAEVIEKELVRVEYRNPVSMIPVLAYISANGRLVTAISISEPCNATRFTIIDGTIKCNNCEARWALDTMKAYSCCPNNYPDPVASEVKNGEIFISVLNLENWRRRL